MFQNTNGDACFDRRAVLKVAMKDEYFDGVLVLHCVQLFRYWMEDLRILQRRLARLQLR
jgi:hypothetical protein